MVLQPRPQLLAAHPVDASGTGVTLDTSERLGKILPGQELLPETCRCGVRCGVTRRRMIAALWTGLLRLHHQSTPSRPLTGLAAVKATITSTNVLRLDFTFSPSQRRTIPPVLWPLLTSPRRAPASRPAPSPTRRHKLVTRHHGTPLEISPGKTSNLHHAPAAYTSRPLDDIGLRHLSWLARTAPPQMRFVYLGSQIRPPASFPPRLTTTQLPSTCGWCHQPPQGLTPPSC